MSERYWRCQHGAKCMMPCPGCPGPDKKDNIRDREKAIAALDDYKRNGGVPLSDLIDELGIEK